MKKYFVLPVAVLLGALTLTSCSEENSDDNNSNNGGDIYSDVSYGNAAMDACDDLGKQLEKANGVIAAARPSWLTIQKIWRKHSMVWM